MMLMVAHAITSECKVTKLMRIDKYLCPLFLAKLLILRHLWSEKHFFTLISHHK